MQWAKQIDSACGIALITMTIYQTCEQFYPSQFQYMKLLTKSIYQQWDLINQSGD